MTETWQPERRQHKRIPFSKEIEVIGEGLHQSVELSVDGMYLKTINAYSVGTVLNLQFRLVDTDDHPISTQGCVLYSQKDIGVGLGFLNLKLEDHQKIEEFIEQQ